VVRNRSLVATLAVAAVLAIWEIAPRLGLVDPFFTSRPSLVLSASVDIVKNGTLLRDTMVSLSEFAGGFALALIIGVPIGLLLGSFATLRYLVDPPMMAIYATPQLALLPVFVLWLGVGAASKVAVVFLGGVLPIIVNTMAGVRDVDRTLVLAARSFGATRRDQFFKVILPASRTAVMIGVRLGLSRAVLGVIVAEMYVSHAGIGFQIMRLGSAFKVNELLFYVLLVSFFGLAATTAARKIEERISR